MEKIKDSKPIVFAIKNSGPNEQTIQIFGSKLKFKPKDRITITPLDPDEDRTYRRIVKDMSKEFPTIGTFRIQYQPEDNDYYENLYIFCLNKLDFEKSIRSEKLKFYKSVYQQQTDIVDINLFRGFEINPMSYIELKVKRYSIIAISIFPQSIQKK